EYERYRQAAEDMDGRPRVGRDLHVARVEPPVRPPRPDPQVSFDELMRAFALVLTRTARIAHHQVRREALSVRERMTEVLTRLNGDRFVTFSDLFDPAEGRLGVVVTFLALLELLKESLVTLVQTEPFAPIHVRMPNHG
ncbi:MAG TPA: ScpA family protein, partial [Acidiferrobacteraceae bacterium]|nr:ScpA family protein [Acidiferrobacteraceae bacterium]